MAPEAARRSILAHLGTTVGGTPAGCATLTDHTEPSVSNLRDEPAGSAERTPGREGCFIKVHVRTDGNEYGVRAY